MTNPNVANPMINNAGAVACAEDTGDLAECLADRLVQSKQDAADRSKKRHKKQDEGIAFMQHHPQPLVSSQPLQPTLSQVMMQLTTSDGPDVSSATESGAQAAGDKPTVMPSAERVVKASDIPPKMKATGKMANPPHNHFTPSTAPPKVSVYSPAAASVLTSIPATDNPVDVVSLRKGGDEPSEKVSDAALTMLRAVAAQPTASAEWLKSADTALPVMPRSDVLAATATDDLSPSVVSKSIDLDLQADQVVVRYAVTDQTSARLQVAEQTIMPASSDGRLNSLLIGQQSLTTFDPGWTLQGIRQAKPYYLATISSQDRMNQTNGTWDERDQ